MTKGDKSGATAYRGEIFYLSGDPANEDGCVHHHADGVLAVRDGHVLSCGPTADSPYAGQAVDTGGIIVPGLVDTHVHYPQLGVMASYGTELLEWLERYTYPAEQAFANPAHCAVEAERFLDAMLGAGTTTALVFATSHPCSADALFAAAHKRNLRLVTGKVLSDRNVPDGLRDTPQRALEESAALIGRWHGRGRLGYAITPRFAPTSSPEQLAVAGQLLAAHDGVLLHTHLSENKGEVRLVGELFPDSGDYVGVYEGAGLVGDRSVFAHCLHLSRREWGALASAGAAVSFCPCSNLFIGSGLFDHARAVSSGVRLGVGSDVGGGNSLSMLRVLDEAYKVARTAGSDIDPASLWYLATLGGATALGMGDKVGSLRPGYEADFVVIDPTATPLLANRLRSAKDVNERMFALAVLGDERNIAAVHVMGEQVAGTRIASLGDAA